MEPTRNETYRGGGERCTSVQLRPGAQSKQHERREYTVAEALSIFLDLPCRLCPFFGALTVSTQ
eukprot:3668365-Amphidinium_carterae.2